MLPLAISLALDVDVLGARDDAGAVRCFLFDAAEAFPANTDAAVAHATAAPRAGHATMRLTAPRAGTFALACFHDEDGDGKLAFGLLGIPSEGTAASRDARGTFGPPAFVDASFVVPVSSQPLRFTLRY